MTTAQQLCSLTLRASSNGQQGVDQVFEQIMVREKSRFLILYRFRIVLKIIIAMSKAMIIATRQRYVDIDTDSVTVKIDSEKNKCDFLTFQF